MERGTMASTGTGAAHHDGLGLVEVEVPRPTHRPPTAWP